MYLSIDNIGYVGDGYPGDQVRAGNVKVLVEEGYLDQILLGGDICMKSHLHAYGGKGYDHVPANFLPLLRQLAISAEALHAMTVVNPARALNINAVGVDHN